MAQNIFPTNRPCFLDLGDGVILEGREADVTPVLPTPLDLTAQAETYRSANIGKTLAVETYFIRFGTAERFGAPTLYDYGPGTHNCYDVPGVPYQTYVEELGHDGRPDQGKPFVGAYDWPGLGTREAEDCLFLSLTRPVGGSDLFSVCHYHGGAWTVNSILGPQHATAYFSAHKGLAAFIAGYRLSTFGHFPHPDVSVPGEPSVAYLDQRLALEWIDTHRAALGLAVRTPAVTGTSAGGAAVHLLMEDDDAQALFSAGWSDSGGGTGNYMGPDAWGLGYNWRVKTYEISLRGMSSVMASMNPLTYRTVADALEDQGFAWSVKNAVRPEHIQCLADMGAIVTAQSVWQRVYGTGDVQPGYRANSENVYPFQRSIYPNAIAAAKDGRYRKPFIASYAECEALNILGSDYTTLRDALRAVPEATLNEWAQRLGYASYSAWLLAPWQPSGPSYPYGLESLSSAQFKRSIDPLAAGLEPRRVLYTHAVFGYAAWRISRAMAELEVAPSWLLVNNFSPNSIWAPHSMLIALLFGNPTWAVGGVQNFPSAVPPGYYANLRMDAIYVSEILMQMLAAFAATGDPAGAYSYEGFDLFDGNPPADGGSLSLSSLTPYTLADPGHANILGKYFDPLNNLNAGTFITGTGTLDLASQRDAHLSYGAFMDAAMLDYLSKLEP